MIKKIALLGPAGTFTDQAADKYQRQQKLNLPKAYFSSISKSLEALCNGTLVVAPIENLIDGFIGVTLDFLKDAPQVFIKAEVIIPISHCLVSLNRNINSIQEIFTQFSTRQQCRNFIESLGVKKIITTESNIASGEMANQKSDSAAIIPFPSVRKFPNLKLLQKDVQDYKDNQTRFIILANRKTQEKNNSFKYKTSLLITEVHDKPGALSAILLSFSTRKINLRSIMSRPTRGKMGKYHFFIDLEIHQETDIFKSAISEVRQHNKVKILGSYPIA